MTGRESESQLLGRTGQRDRDWSGVTERHGVPTAGEVDERRSEGGVSGDGVRGAAADVLAEGGGVIGWLQNRGTKFPMSGELGEH